MVEVATTRPFGRGKYRLVWMVEEQHDVHEIPPHPSPGQHTWCEQEIDKLSTQLLQTLRMNKQQGEHCGNQVEDTQPRDGSPIADNQSMTGPTPQDACQVRETKLFVPDSDAIQFLL